MLTSDTDSIFFSIESFVEKHVGLEKWNSLTVDDKIIYCKRITNTVSEHVNNKAFDVVQTRDFNSRRQDFKIIFEQEIIAQAGLFVAKKKYGLGIVDKAGRRVDELFIRGLEIVQSLTPIIIKPKLKNMMQLILSGTSDKVISKVIRADKKELMLSHPNDIAVNVAARNLRKYIINGKPAKGAPWAVKGINNYNNTIKSMGIDNKYEALGGVGEKIKLVYIKTPNMYNIDTIGFIHWPEEFNWAGIKIDYSLMIDKYYLKKIENLLSPVGKSSLVSGGDIGGFFG